MDVKGIAWVGHVYQKFEAMFLEVEEIMYEDTVKYVENQVQNVGASVKKFYSEVMDDLNPPTLLRDEKVDTSELPDKQYSNVLICKKPSKGMEMRIGCPDALTGKSTEKIKVTADVQKGNANTLSSTSPKDSVKKPWKSTEKIKVTADVQKGNANTLSSTSPKDSVKKPFVDSCSRWGDGNISKQIDASVKGSLEKRVPQAKNPLGKTSICEASLRDQLDETTLLIEGANDEIENGKNVTTDVSSCGDSITEHDGVVNRLVAEVASPLNEVDEVFVSHPGRLDWWDLHEIESDAIVDQEKRSIRQLDSTDESCVMISKGDDLHFVSHKQGKNRPYRKKIKEAFTTKKRLMRTQEYEHLAEWYGLNPERGESMMGDVEVETQNPGENDWELL